MVKHCHKFMAEKKRTTHLVWVQDSREGFLEVDSPSKLRLNDGQLVRNEGGGFCSKSWEMGDTGA